MKEASRLKDAAENAREKADEAVLVIEVSQQAVAKAQKHAAAAEKTAREAEAAAQEAAEEARSRMECELEISPVADVPAKAPVPPTPSPVP